MKLTRRGIFALIAATPIVPAMTEMHAIDARFLAGIEMKPVQQAHVFEFIVRAAETAPAT